MSCCCNSKHKDSVTTSGKDIQLKKFPDKTSGKIKIQINIDKLKYSNEKLKKTISNELQEKESFYTRNFKKFKSVRNYPAHDVFAKLAKKAYKDYDKNSDEIYKEDLPEGWKLLTTATNNDTNNGYFGAAFWNPKKQQVIIAHRGTKFKRSNIFGALWTNIIGVMWNKRVAQMDSACSFTYLITTILNELNEEKQANFQLFFTGHSLGGWLAQITTFTAKYLSLINNDFIFGTDNEKGFHAHAVVFDSPGCEDMLKDMLNKLKDHFPHCSNKNDLINDLDITSYLSAPNIVNTRNKHVGTIYRIFVDLEDMKSIEDNTILYNLATHKIKKILKAIKCEDLKKKQVVDWPISNGICCLEMTQFFKWANNLNKYDADLESKSYDLKLKPTIRYQVKDVVKNIHHINIFTQAERSFLERYQCLRSSGNFETLKLFNGKKDTKIRITKRLQNFQIKENLIICQDKEDLKKLIPCVKSLLDIQKRSPKLLNKIDIECPMKAIIDSQYSDHRELVKTKFQDFTDDKELKALINNLEQVSLVSVEENTSFGLARIYKACTENAARDETKDFVLNLEMIFHIKKYFYFKQTMTDFVEALVKDRSLILVECPLNCNDEHQKKFLDDFLDVFKTFRNQSETKIILVFQSSSKIPDLQLDLEMRKLMPPTWNNLSNQFQEELLNKQLIVFQGQKGTSLKELIGDNNEKYSMIASDPQILLALINDEVLINDNRKSSMCQGHYMKRTFTFQREISLNQYLETGENNTESYSESKLLNKNENMIIISDTAGMGKSTVLTFLDQEIKKQKPASLVFRIDLNMYTEQLDTMKKLKKMAGFKVRHNKKTFEEAIQFIAESVFKIADSSKQILFQFYCQLNIGNMIVMLDGFDEISPDYKDEVIDLVRALRNGAIKQIWITTRPNMQKELENEFQQFAHALKPFSEEDQHKFLTEFWQESLNLGDEINKDKFKTFAGALIKLLAKSISDKDASFTGIPLQTKMLAEAFQNDSHRFFKSNEIVPKLPENLDLIDLYEHFLKNKHEIYQMEKNGLDLTKTGNIEQNEKLYSKFIREHEIMALNALFNEEEFEQHFQKEKEKLSSLMNKIKEGKLNYGLIDRVINDKPQFVHHTFAEYLVAKYLVDNLENQALAEFVLQSILIKSDYQIIRAFFNGLLKENSSQVRLSECALKIYGEQIKNLWLKNENNLFNEEGNSLLHVAAEEDNENIARFLLKSLENIDNDLKLKIMEVPDKITFRHYTALFLAVAKGHLKISKCLVENGACVNWTNQYGGTVLHMTARSGNLELVKYLIEKGADVNAKDKDGGTVLHRAAESGNLELMKYLVEEGADVNAKDGDGITVIHMAAKFGNLELVKYLIEKGADVNAKDKNDGTVMDMAAKFGNLELVKYLKEKGASG